LPKEIGKANKVLSNLSSRYLVRTKRTKDAFHLHRLVTGIAAVLGKSTAVPEAAAAATFPLPATACAGRWIHQREQVALQYVKVFQAWTIDNPQKGFQFILQRRSLFQKAGLRYNRVVRHGATET